MQTLRAKGDCLIFVPQKKYKMNLRYDKAELMMALRKKKAPLHDNAIYYFSPGKQPGTTYDKGMLADDRLTPIRSRGLTFNSARHLRSFLSVLMATCKQDFPITEESILSSKGMLKDVYLAKTPGDASRTARSVHGMLDMDTIDFTRLLAYRLKFGMNKFMTDHLLQSGDMFLVYAHVNDRSEGIWMDPVTAARCRNTNEWKGDNRAGRTLMRVREELSTVPFERQHKERSVYPNTIVVQCRNSLLLDWHLDTIASILNFDRDVLEDERVNEELHRIHVDVGRGSKRIQKISAVVTQLQDYPGMKIIQYN